ncbi:uncharacterized protein FA14DRAFT_179004 [Meira miltonrushii]|uniref:UNC-45/Cro1/She4 central domain-containing protein n=1 Tax=Meira miltonrushii TaxID=1280837 RepID=A0A316VDA3_9BASI|nr:uncharacterized protein FA14DRAFT_179004 [Meira miltonrushii]PWN35639.1 hypothetical protein FA14DRAFT_179004 [Meira miltonrushii]
MNDHSIASSANLGMLANLSIDKESSSMDEILHAFRPESIWKDRALTIVRLAKRVQTSSAESNDFSKECILSIQSALKYHNSDQSQAFAAIRFISGLYTFAPQQAHKILFDHDVLDLALSSVTDTKDQQSFTINSLAVAELLCLAASYNESRKKIVEVSNESPTEDAPQAKIVEVTEEDELRASRVPMEWLVSLVERTELENPPATSMLSKVSLLASLALHKLTRVGKAPTKGDAKVMEGGLEGLPKDKDAEEAEEKKQAEEDAFLNEMCRRHILLGKEAEIKSFAEAGDSAIDLSLKKELARLCQVSAIEGLSYLSLQPVYRHSIANDTDLLKAICNSAKDATQLGDTRTLFPSRDAEKSKESAKSSYELDKLLDPKTMTGAEEAPDTAMQLGIASLLANIMSYPATKSKEEQQMDKLRRMANARNAEGTDEKDQFLTLDAIEERVRRVISVKGIEALVSIAMSKSHSGSGGDGSVANPSASVRQSVAEALLYATTRQDKRQRGFIIQQGGAKALIALSNSTVAQALRSQGDENVAATPLSFTAIQALSHLLITENPALVSADPIEVVPSLALLFLHADSSRLQRFEASLALTNVASLSPQLANRIAHAGFAKSVLDTNATDAFVGADRGKESKGRLDVGSILRERIFMEDNELSRRASLELLCNLLVVDDVFQRWSGETDDENKIKSSVKKDEKEKDEIISKSRAARDLTFLIALCAPAGIDEAGKESGLKLRMAAGGAIATLCSSASACARILSLEPRIINKIAKLIDPMIEVKQVDQISEISGEDDKGDPEEDARLHRQDIESDPLGSEHGQWQLALRGLSCIECLLQYVDWIRGQGTNDATAYKRAISASGLVEAVKSIAKSGTKALKENNPSKPIKTLQMQVTKQALELLKIIQHLGLLES